METDKDWSARALEFLVMQASLGASDMLDVMIFHDTDCPTVAAVNQHLELIGWGVSDLILMVAGQDG